MSLKHIWMPMSVELYKMKNKKTHIIFIKQVNKIFPDLKILGEYTGVMKDIVVEDTLGIKYITKPNYLLNGSFPCLQSAIDKQDALQKKVDNAGLSLTVIQPYVKRFKKVIVRDVLGVLYSVTPDKLFVGKKPSLQTAVDPTDGFIKKARKIHGDKYNYSKAIYTKDNIKLIITCPLHGDFEQLASNHLAGQGCYYCGIESMKLNRPENGFSRTQWIDYCNNNNKSPKLYILQCQNSQELFIKVGITTRNVIQRNGNGRYWKTNMPYKHSILAEIKGNSEWCFDTEKKIERKYNDFKYKPLLYFNGLTECYNYNILDNVLNDANGKGVIP